MQNSIFQLKSKKYLSSIENYSWHWDGQPAIIAKMDWFSGVFKNVSVGEVFSVLGIDDYDTVDFRELFAKRFEIDKSGISEVVFNYNGVMFEVRLLSILSELGLSNIEDADIYNVFNLRMDYVRLNISGSGLDFLRNLGMDVDIRLRERLEFEYDYTNEYLPSFHPTRVDVAFDLLNYHPDFIDQCKELCRRVQDPRTLRVPVLSKGSIKWSERGGDQNTLYFGSTGSDKLLRIYDKKLQYIQSNKFVSNCPYKNGDQLPDSWIRFELQSRRPIECSFVLYDCNSYIEVFKYVYNKFAIREVDKTFPSKRVIGEVSKIWSDLFDWNIVPSMFQNSYFVQFVHPLVRAQNHVFTTKVDLWVLRSIMSWDSVGQMLDEEFHRIQTSGLESDKRCLRRFEQKIMSLGDFKLPEYIYKDDHGIMSFKDSTNSPVFSQFIEQLNVIVASYMLANGSNPLIEEINLLISSVNKEKLIG